MVSTINMQDMRYLNLFGKVTKIATRFCFMYNETIVFCVPKQLVPRAIGPEGKNVKQISTILGKKIKIIPIPKNEQHLKPFIGAIVSPVTFKEVEISGNEVILTAGNQSKAALLGRNKRRLIEMQKIIADFFGKEFKII